MVCYVCVTVRVVVLLACCRRDLETGKIIDTVSVQRAAAMIRPWIEHMEPFILVGPEGCGKSMLISHMVRYPVITVPHPRCLVQCLLTPSPPPSPPEPLPALSHPLACSI